MAFARELDSTERALLRALLGTQPPLTHHGELLEIRALAPAFEEFFTRYGHGLTSFGSEEEMKDEPLAHMDPTGNVAAFAARRGAGAIYAIPDFVTSLQTAHDRLIRSLYQAVIAHRDQRKIAPAAHLHQLQLPRENHLLESIASMQTELVQAQAKAGALERYRQLLGTTSGAGFEELVIDSLNLVLSPTPYSAEDRDEQFNEDFVITGPEGDYALAEAKGLGSHVKQEHVSHLEMIRSRTRPDDEDPPVPGLLVVNIRRNEESLEARRAPVHPAVCAQAARLNVLILRGIDLYHSVGAALNDPGTGERFLEHLGAGGGWLEVSADGPAVLHT